MKHHGRNAKHKKENCMSPVTKIVLTREDGTEEVVMVTAPVVSHDAEEVDLVVTHEDGTTETKVFVPKA